MGSIALQEDEGMVGLGKQFCPTYIWLLVGKSFTAGNLLIMRTIFLWQVAEGPFPLASHQGWALFTIWLLPWLYLVQIFCSTSFKLIFLFPHRNELAAYQELSPDIRVIILKALVEARTDVSCKLYVILDIWIIHENFCFLLTLVFTYIIMGYANLTIGSIFTRV